MSQEARGLDAGPRLVDRLIGWGDHRSAAIVARIGQEEKAHVAVGIDPPSPHDALPAFLLRSQHHSHISWMHGSSLAWHRRACADSDHEADAKASLRPPHHTASGDGWGLSVLQHYSQH